MEILDNIVRILIVVALIIVCGMYFRLSNRFKEVDAERFKFIHEHNIANSHIDMLKGEIQTLEEAVKLEAKAHQKTIEDYISEYRKDAMNALIHLAENAIKDEVKLTAATQVMHIVSPRPFTNVNT